MKKRCMFKTMTLAAALVILSSGCGMKKSSYVMGGNEENTRNDSKTEEDETYQIVEYKSLIEKYVGKTGESYKSYDWMERHDDEYEGEHNKIMPLIYPAKEWLDSEVKLRLPFDPHDIESSGIFDYHGTKQEITGIDERIGTVSYYIPKEIAVKASTGELIDVLWSYGCNVGYIMALRTPMNPILFEYEFNQNVAHSNALEESLRRADFASEYMKKYMAETENMPEYYEGMEDEDISLFMTYMYGCKHTHTLDMFEVVLAQPEAYAQLTDSQRTELVKRVIERFELGEQGKLCISSHEYDSLFFACITGKCYLSGRSAYEPFDKGELEWRIIPYTMGEIQWQDNPWINAINKMDLTDDERKIWDKYFVSNK